MAMRGGEKPVQVTGAGGLKRMWICIWSPMKSFVVYPSLGTTKIFFTRTWAVLYCPMEGPLSSIDLTG